MKTCCPYGGMIGEWKVFNYQQITYVKNFLSEVNASYLNWCTVKTKTKCAFFFICKQNIYKGLGK